LCNYTTQSEPALLQVKFKQRGVGGPLPCKGPKPNKLVHLSDLQRIVGAGLQECQQFFLGRRFIAEPFGPIGFSEDDRRAVVQLRHQLVRTAGQDGAAEHLAAGLRVFPLRPEPGHVRFFI
jgi:hypothetical protein